jgi:hypothetical protein
MDTVSNPHTLVVLISSHLERGAAAVLAVEVGGAVRVQRVEQHRITPVALHAQPLQHMQTPCH